MDKKYLNLINQISKVVLGKQDQIRLALTCLFAKGHLLIEDIPGIGKTTLAKALSKCLGLDFKRIQFTSDLLPADILGFSIFDQNASSFVFHKGPIFTQVLLADEINRATPKTQSALLEAMEEKQVTIEGKTKKLTEPFFVIATQNPLEQAGTFMLPESQMDRFLMRISIGYPSRDAENTLLKGEDVKHVLDKMPHLLETNDVINIQKEIINVHISDPLFDYIQDIVEYTRKSSAFHIGLSPRAGLSLLAATKSWAHIDGRDYAIPEDVQNVIYCVIGHRLRSKDDMGLIDEHILTSLINEVPIP